MRIGELGKMTGCPVETIRYYEREGLLGEPGRSHGNYRLYDFSHLERLTFIRNCRALEMSLEEIRTLLRIKEQAGHDCGEVSALLDEHIAHVSERIAKLKGLETQLLALREQCRRVTPVAECAILLGLGERMEGPSRAEDREGSHVSGAHSGKH